MRKYIFGLLVGFLALFAVTTHISAAEAEEVPNMSIKVSPSIPRAGEPVIYEAVLSGGTGSYQVGWWFLDPFEILLSTNRVPSRPELIHGLTVTNTFKTGGIKEAFILIQEAGSTNGIEKFISMRLVAFAVQESQDSKITLQYPNGNEMWIPGNTYEIKWNTNGSVRNVTITLEHKENTNSIPTLISAYTENDGSFNFTVPYGTNWVSKGSEGNLGGKNYRVRVTPLDITALFGSGGSGGNPFLGENDNPSSLDTFDVSDDWFTISRGIKLNPLPLSLRNLEFSEARVVVDNTVVGKSYRIESSANLKDWRTNKVFRAEAENSTNSFYISGSPSESFRVVEIEN